MSAPLFVDRDNTLPVPDSWCVVVCEQGCQESWAVDVDDVRVGDVTTERTDAGER